MLKVIDETKVSQRFNVLLEELVDSFFDFRVVWAPDSSELFDEIDAAISQLPWLLGSREAVVHAASTSFELWSE